MFRRLASCNLALTTVLLLFAGSAGAVNLLVNPDFATTVVGWAAESEATLAWSPVDATGSPTSGSALIANISAGAQNGTGIVQCVDGVIAGATYTFGGRVLFPPGQARTGEMQIGLRWLSAPNCGGSVVGSQPRLNTNTPQSVWVLLTSAPLVAPPGALSAQFVAFPSKVEAGGQLVGQFDDLLFDGPPPPPPPPPIAATDVPVLPPLMLVLLAALLGVVGALRIGRR
jgi:hypothetical protein